MFICVYCKRETRHVPVSPFLFAVAIWLFWGRPTSFQPHHVQKNLQQAALLPIFGETSLFVGFISLRSPIFRYAAGLDVLTCDRFFVTGSGGSALELSDPDVSHFGGSESTKIFWSCWDQQSQFFLIRLVRIDCSHPHMALFFVLFDSVRICLYELYSNKSLTFRQRINKPPFFLVFLRASELVPPSRIYSPWWYACARKLALDTSERRN